MPGGQDFGIKCLRRPAGFVHAEPFAPGGGQLHILGELDALLAIASPK